MTRHFPGFACIITRPQKPAATLRPIYLINMRTGWLTLISLNAYPGRLTKPYINKFARQYISAKFL